MIAIKLLEIRANSDIYPIADTFFTSKKKIKNRIDNLCKKYKLDKSLLTIICWQHIDNIANAVLDDSTCLTETAYKTACTWFNQDMNDNELLEMYYETLQSELTLAVSAYYKTKKKRKRHT